VREKRGGEGGTDQGTIEGLVIKKRKNPQNGQDGAGALLWGCQRHGAAQQAIAFAEPQCAGQRLGVGRSSFGWLPNAQLLQTAV